MMAARVTKRTLPWNEFRLQRRLNLKPSVLEEVYATIAEIDAVKNSWRVTGKLLPQTLQRLTHSVIVTSTGSSNRIEGNKLSDAEVERLYKNLWIKKFKTRDEQEVVGYLETLELIFKNYQRLSVTESFILQLHRDMLRYSSKDQRHKGNYKFGSNRVEAKDHSGKIIGVIFDPTPPYLVPNEMQKLTAWYVWTLEEKKKHPLLLIANFIFEFLAIHPFQDGNGRVSCLLSNLMLLQHDYLFTQVVSHERLIEANKADYYLALNQTQRKWKKKSEEITPWLLFFLKIIQQQSREALQLLESDSIERLLSEKQLALWQWANRVTQFSRKEATSALGFPERTIESIIKKLVDLKRLQRLGEGKATRYRVVTIK